MTHHISNVPPPDPDYDLVTWVEHQQATGEAEIDPYSYAVTLIRVALEFSLDDGIQGAMNETEFNVLKAIAYKLSELDPDIDIQPKGW